MSLAQAAATAAKGAPPGDAPATNGSTGAGITPAGAGDGAGSLSPANGQAAGAAAQGAESSANGQAGAYRPQGLPDHLAGGSDPETIDKLFKAFDGFRRAEAERGAVPKDPKGYTFTPDDKLKPYVSDLENDGFFSGVREDFLAAGLTDRQANAVLNRVMSRLVDSGTVAQPVDYGSELAALVPAEAKTQDEATQKTAVEKRINNSLAWLDGARRQGLPEDVATYALAQLGDTAKGIQFIEWVRNQAREVQPAFGGGGGRGVTESELEARVADPRNDPRSSKFDQGFAEQTTEMFKQFSRQQQQGR